MTIRTFESGDAAAQVSIYNEAAADLPHFKPATLDEVRRRMRGSDFDAGARFVAVDNGVPVGYATFHGNGRVSYPWCRKGHERCAGPLFDAVLAEMRRRGLPAAFAAYRADWTPQKEFFLAQGFRLARDMVNFVLNLGDLPTPAARPTPTIEPLEPGDVAAVQALGKGVLRTRTAEELQRHLFDNSYFDPDACFLLRSRSDGMPLAIGILILDAAYADPPQQDAGMPCFRLGAFGTEGMQWKRINGLFSFLAAPGKDVNPLGLELLSHAIPRLYETELETLAAQVPSDAPHLLRFYEQLFRKQGSFPVFEQAL